MCNELKERESENKYVNKIYLEIFIRKIEEETIYNIQSK